MTSKYSKKDWDWEAEDQIFRREAEELLIYLMGKKAWKSLRTDDRFFLVEETKYISRYLP